METSNHLVGQWETAKPAQHPNLFQQNELDIKDVPLPNANPQEVARGQQQLLLVVDNTIAERTAGGEQNLYIPVLY